MVVDLSSTNGTYVNNKRLESSIIVRSNDVITRYEHSLVKCNLVRIGQAMKNKGKMFIRLKNTTFVPTIIIILISYVWCYIVLEERIELFRAIVLIVFMNIISTINYYEDIIPDKINLLLGATGLVSNLTTGMVSIPSMIGGILIGGGSLYLKVIYEILTKRA